MKKTLMTLALAVVLPLCAIAGPIEPGRPLPALRLKNQHDQDWQVPVSTRLVVFAAGRKASNLVMAVLGQQHQGFLASRHAVYLADMSQMPGLITRTFALPALREQPFEVGVAPLRSITTARLSLRSDRILPGANRSCWMKTSDWNGSAATNSRRRKTKSAFSSPPRRSRSPE